MTRLLFIAAAGFLVGALLVTVIRTVGHQPYGMPEPAPSPAVPAPTPAPAASHAGHGMPSTPAPAATAPAAARVINTICPLCGMDVDPKIPPAAWEGVLVGFGCRACPPEFAKDPAKYGAAARTNTVVEP